MSALRADAVFPWECKCLSWQSTGNQDLDTKKGVPWRPSAELID